MSLDPIRLNFVFPGLLLALVATGSAQTSTPGPTPTVACTDDTWTATSPVNAPAARSHHTAVWTGSEMIVWGGYDNAGAFNTGGRYNPSTDSWGATSTTNAPSARFNHTVVWTGSDMIVWGGFDYGGPALNTGARYNSDTDSWTATSLTNAPTSRGFHTAVWTGAEMIVWGGYFYDGSFHHLNTGARYNPDTDGWIAISTTNAPTAREIHVAVWTGSEMIVWGGYDVGYSNTGGRYNPVTDSWTSTSIANAPSARGAGPVIWTGTEMIVWGGYNANTLNTGGRYNPGPDSWTATGATNAPAARLAHTAVWTGSKIILWGGQGSIPFNTGGRYDPLTDSWGATSTTSAPTARFNHTAVWTGSEMIVWGGFDANYFSTGGRYCAQPPPTVNISGNISCCSSQIPSPVPNVTLTLTSDATTSTMTDGSGSYMFSSLAAGRSFTIAPGKTALTPTSPGINTLDVMAAQRHYLNIASLTGCQLVAADVNGDTIVNTSDVIAIQQFFIGRTFGTGNVGKYQFTPANRSYPEVMSDQIAQNYNTLIFGDVVPPFAD